MKKNHKKFEGMTTNYDFFAGKRTVGHCTQFWAIFKRNLVYLIRNPRTLRATVFNGVFMGLLVLSLFEGVGEYDLKKITTDPAIRGRF